MLFVVVWFFASCDILDPDPPKGACVYGPFDADIEHCLYTTESVCDEDFNSGFLESSWHEGEECP